MLTITIGMVLLLFLLLLLLLLMMIKMASIIYRWWPITGKLMPLNTVSVKINGIDES